MILQRLAGVKSRCGCTNGNSD